MKRIVLLLALLFGCCYAFAENPELSFKGIPLNQSMSSFVRKLERKGFRKINGTRERAFLKGAFLSNPGAYVTVLANESNGKVKRVVARVPAGANWNEIVESYTTTVELYATKYGQPTVVTETFDGNPALSEKERNHAIDEGRCNYKQEWSPKGGTISVYIGRGYGSHIAIICDYQRHQDEKEILDSIHNEI